jgi:hypothetical protein
MRPFALVATVVVLLFAAMALAKMADPGAVKFVLLRDAIPAVTDPTFEGGAVTGTTFVVGLAIDGDARAYPLPILSIHEIVNDEVGGTPVAVTYCPLCGTGIVFDRRVEGQVLTFKVSGRLYQNNLVMYDVETNSQWSQLLGEAITGPLEGTKLQVVSSTMASFAAWQSLHPDTQVLAPPRPGGGYAVDPYASYYSSSDTLFPIRVPDPTMHPKAFVLGVVLNGEAMAFPYEVLRREPVVNVDVGGVGLVVTFQLDFAAAWERDGRLFFRANGTTMVDDLGREWNTATGEALGGGERLVPVRAVPGFWFAWKDFYPETAVYGDPTPFTGTLNSGFLISSSFLFFLLLLVVIALAAWDLYRHVARRGAWADPKWRSAAGQGFWAVLGVAFGAFAVADGFDSLALVYRVGGVVLGLAFVVLGVHLAWQAVASYGHDVRRTALGGEETRRRIDAFLTRRRGTFEARLEGDRLGLYRDVRRYLLDDGTSFAVDAAGTVLVPRRGGGRDEATVLRVLVDDALLADPADFEEEDKGLNVH